MRSTFRWASLLVSAVVLTLATGAGCECSGTVDSPRDGSVKIDGATGALTLEPTDPTITLVTGQAVPTVKFIVRENGQPVSATFRIDRPATGAIDGTGLFTPSGSAGGTTTVQATTAGGKISTTLTIEIQGTQNGEAGPDGGIGVGGYRGVGGEGPGPALPDSTKAILDGPHVAEPSLAFLYPYDQTLWPLDQLAPLIQWKATPALLSATDGVLIHLSAKSYEFKGYFGRPGLLAAGAPFQRHPIPQDVWASATQTAAGGTLALDLTLSSGGKSIGPIHQTWKIARGALKGVVYYQSYGTNLAKNLTGAQGGDGRFGGATLAIKPGRTDPSLVAGKDGDHADCRVCHSVSSDGSRMVVQHGENYEATSSYDLKNGYAETPYGGPDFKFAGLFPDGSVGLTHRVSGPFQSNGPATLYDMKTGAVLPSPGLATFVTSAGFPAFSPDGKSVAFNFFEGPGGAGIAKGDGSRLVAMAFEKSTGTFSTPKVLHASTADHPPAWPSFLPTGGGVVFETVLPGNTSKEPFATRYGGRGELWWSDVATGTAHRLDALNGKTGLPTSAEHPDDSVVNYEPTVCPLPSGGYAWIVFMSRRLYGNVATIDPWWSDPREHDLFAAATPKKLWVAAIDLNAPVGTDPSHPAFYLPAQELFAGNTRGFWVVDPCQDDGAPCDSGDQCCGGFCALGEVGGVCTSQSQGCSKEYDKCATASDCCDPSLQCINARCVGTGPN